MTSKIFATFYTKIFHWSFIWNWCCKGQLLDSLAYRSSYFRNHKL